MRTTIGLALWATGCDHPAVEEAPVRALMQVNGVEIVGTAHGEPLGSDGKTVAVSEDDVLTLQRALLAEVMATAAQQKSGLDVAAQELLGAAAFTKDEELVVNDEVLGWLMTDPGLAQSYKDASGILVTSAALLSQNDEAFWTLRPDLTDTFLKRGVDVLARYAAARAAGNAYLDECRDQQVPIPPNWPSGPTGGWTFWGDMDVSEQFLATGTTQIWIADNVPSSEGLCVALPRLVGEETIGLMGFVCQSAATGKACFWDNIDGAYNRRLSGDLYQPMEIATLKNGNTLAENCTACHRGDNAFIIHPGEALSFLGAERSPVWYEPVSTQPSWENPPPSLPRGVSPCSGCHAIPALSPRSRYCDTVLAGAARMKMPSTSWPIGWPPPPLAARPAGEPDYTYDAGRLYTICNP